MGMEYRKLGRTGLEISAIGLGTEYLNKQPRKIVASVVQQAIEHGVNYFDIVFSFPRYLDNLGAALKGRRKRVCLTGHLGSTEKNGQYFKTRNAKRSEVFFLDLLSRLDTDYVDVLFLHNFNTLKEFDGIAGPGGVLELAGRLQREGKARFIGISTHSIEVANRAIESGPIDVLMFPIHMAANAVPGKKVLLQACATRQVGVVAMKPFAGGKLLHEERSIRVARYQMGEKRSNSTSRPRSRRCSACPMCSRRWASRRPCQAAPTWNNWSKCWPMGRPLRRKRILAPSSRTCSNMRLGNVSTATIACLARRPLTSARSFVWSRRLNDT